MERGLSWRRPHQRCVDAALAATSGAGKIEWTPCEAGVDIMATAGTPMPQETIDTGPASDATLKAPHHHAIGTGFRSVNVLLRQTLDLYACIRPCKTYKGVRSRHRRHRYRHHPREHRGPVRRRRIREGQARHGRPNQLH